MPKFKYSMYICPFGWDSELQTEAHIVTDAQTDGVKTITITPDPSQTWGRGV